MFTIHSVKDFVLEIPQAALKSPGYFFTSVIRREPYNDTVLVMLARKSDSLWFYRIGEQVPYKRIGLAEHGIREVSSTYWNEVESKLYVLDEKNGSLLELEDMDSIVAYDTLPNFTDSSGVFYSTTGEFVANQYKVVSTIGAYTSVDSFIQRPCVGEYSRKRGVWEPVAWHPKDIQDHPERFEFYPMVSATSGYLDSVFFRYRVSDSVSLYANNEVTSVVRSNLPGIQYEELKPPEIGPSEHFIIAPMYMHFAVWDIGFVTLGWDRIDLRTTDGSLNDVYAKPIFILVTDRMGTRTSVVHLPQNFSIYDPPFIHIGNSYALIDKDKQNPKDRSKIMYTIVELIRNI